MPVSDQGIDLDRYMLIPRVLIFIRNGTRFLLLKGDEKKTRWAGLYNGLGGHVESGEDVFRAAERELWEEAGLMVDHNKTPGSDKLTHPVKDFWICGTLLVDTGTNPGIGIYVFLGEYDSSETIASPEGALHWVEASIVPNLPCVEDLPYLVRHISKMRKGDAPFSARSYYKDGKLIIQFSQ